jgi:hypothetical protein
VVREVDHSKDPGSQGAELPVFVDDDLRRMVGECRGEIRPFERDSSDSETEDLAPRTNNDSSATAKGTKNSTKSSAANNKRSRFGFFSGLSSLVGSKTQQTYRQPWTR